MIPVNLSSEAHRQLLASYPRGLKRYLRRLLFNFAPYPTWNNCAGKALRRLKIWSARIYFTKVEEPFHSQYGQDVVAAVALGSESPVSYLDIGAHNGVSFSNSLVFERNGGHGICVEPMPETFQELASNRTAICICCAVGKADGSTANFVSVTGQGSMLSHIETAEESADKKRRIQEAVASGLATQRIVEVQVKSVSTILKEAGFEKVDFVSIDTEGQEMQVLKNTPLQKMGVKVVTIECNADDSLECVLYMRKQGYHLHCALGDDLLFIRR